MNILKEILFLFLFMLGYFNDIFYTKLLIQRMLKVNKLKGQFNYLIGSMDAAHDGGKGWREELTPWLQSKGVIVLNPCDKPMSLDFNEDTAREDIARLKEEEKYGEIREKYGIIRAVDLRMTDKADFLIFYLNLDVLTVGSFEEAFTSNRAKKPVLIVIEQTKKKCPNWLLWTFPHEHIFSSFNELKEYLDGIDNGTDERTFKRWVYFNQEKLHCLS